jgi:hypothetical protein
MSIEAIDERREYQREAREWLAAGGIEVNEPTCRECGCSDSLACPEGCWWVQDDLCSECAADLETAAIEGGRERA